VPRFRALEARYLPPIQREVQADEVFDVPDGQYAEGLKDQPYFEEITQAAAKKDED
jgi:hypothetical protein